MTTVRANNWRRYRCRLPTIWPGASRPYAQLHCCCCCYCCWHRCHGHRLMQSATFTLCATKFKVASQPDSQPSSHSSNRLCRETHSQPKQPNHYVDGLTGNSIDWRRHHHCHAGCRQMIWFRRVVQPISSLMFMCSLARSRSLSLSRAPAPPQTCHHYRRT